MLVPPMHISLMMICTRGNRSVLAADALFSPPGSYAVDFTSSIASEQVRGSQDIHPLRSVHFSNLTQYLSLILSRTDFTCCVHCCSCTIPAMKGIIVFQFWLYIFGNCNCLPLEIGYTFIYFLSLVLICYVRKVIK